MTFTIGVVGPTLVPTGTVTVMDDGTPIGSVALSNGQATFTTATLSSAGDEVVHLITILYNGTASIAQSESETIAVLVNPATTTVSLTDSEYSEGNVFYYGTPVTFTAQVTGWDRRPPPRDSWSSIATGPPSGWPR